MKTNTRKRGTPSTPLSSRSARVGTPVTRVLRTAINDVIARLGSSSGHGLIA